MLIERWRDSDLAWLFGRSPRAMLSFGVAALLVVVSVLAPWLAPQNPFDLAGLSLLDALKPPAWMEGGDRYFPFGADGQGRDVLSAILYGTRTSLAVGLAAVALSLVLGISLGLLAGYLGGFVDAVIMRLADVQWSFPAILIALLIDGVARTIVSQGQHDRFSLLVLVLAIGLAGWVPFARTVRATTMVEKSREYVQAARVTGVRPLRIMVAHILPNTLGPVLVLATIQLAAAIIIEATLSFLGVGVPPTQPSLGTLIRVGSSMLMSGEWWVTLFPSLTLAAIVLSINVFGDWLRDALNPKLRR